MMKIKTKAVVAAGSGSRAAAEPRQLRGKHGGGGGSMAADAGAARQ